MPKTLDLANVINVTVQGTPQNLNSPNINTCAIFTQEAPSGWGGATYKIYTNASEVATDFGSGSVIAGMAAAFFAQQPNPLVSGGYLVAIPRLTSPSLESVQAAILRMKDTVYFFGILIDEEMHNSETAFDNLCDYVQSLDKVFFYASSDVSDYASGGMLDDIRAASNTHTRCLYHTSTPKTFAAAYAGRALSTNFAGSNTTQTLHLKSLATIEPDTTIDQTALAAVQAAGVDVYVSVTGISVIFTSGENEFFDQVYNELAFKFALQTAGFNYLRGTNSKVPQTERGMEGLKNAYRQVCDQFVINGFIGPGTWTSPDTFGDPEALRRNITDQGYYVYSLPLSQQSSSDRADRIAPLVQIAAKSQGAIHKSNVIANINK